MENRLFQATKLGRIEVMRTVLSRGVDVNIQDSNGNSLLHVAVLNKNKETVKFLLESGADVHLKNKKAHTPLISALNNLIFQDEMTNCNIIKMLVMDGADVNSASKNYCRITALHAAAWAKDVGLVQRLISLGADVNAKERYDGYTPLHIAAENIKSEDPSVFEILLSAGVDVNAQDNDGWTAFHVLLTQPVECSLVDILKVFIKYGADFNVKDNHDFTAVERAFFSSNADEGIKACIICGVMDINRKFFNVDSGISETILHLQCFYGNYSMIKFLLKNGADINALDEDNAPPLERIVLSAVTLTTDERELKITIFILNYLLKFNPDVNFVTSYDSNILAPPWGTSDDLPVIYWQTIIQHIAKLKMSERPIHKNILEIISNSLFFKNYYTSCISELKFAKSLKLHPDCTVSFFNVLMDSKKKLFQYAGNKYSRYNFTFRCNKLFPIYCTLMNKKFSKAIKKRLTWESSAIALTEILPIPKGLEHDIIEIILKFMDEKDLEKVCQ